MSRIRINHLSFLCLLVSGGNSQNHLVKSFDEMEMIGKPSTMPPGGFRQVCQVMGLGYQEDGGGPTGKLGDRSGCLQQTTHK